MDVLQADVHAPPPPAPHPLVDTWSPVCDGVGEGFWEEGGGLWGGVPWMG